MISRVTCVIAVLTALARLGMAVAAADTKPVLKLRARVISERIELDGVLNDPVWQSVPAASGFTQREPRAGQPATEETEVLVVSGTEAPPRIHGLVQRGDRCRGCTPV